MNKKMKKMIGLAAFSGAAAAAGFLTGRMRRYKGKHVCQGIPKCGCEFTWQMERPIGEEKHVCADEISEFSGVDVRDAARHILNGAKVAEISCLKENEMEAAEHLLSAYIGFLRKEAPFNEQNLATLMLLLVNTEDNGPDEEPDVVSKMIDDATDAMPYEELMACGYYDAYQDYWLWTEDKRTVILACQKAVADILADRACS